MQDLISIVIPVYNVEPYLNTCIESILNQTYSNLEIIAVNDSSTDRSPEILQYYQRKDFRLQICNDLHSFPQGTGYARNIGLEQAKGKYLFFVDGDDYLPINSIQKISQFMTEENLEICLFNGTPFYHTPQVENPPKYYPLESTFNIQKKQYKRLKTFLAYFHSACMKAYSLKFLKKHQILFPIHVYGEDVEFWLKCLLKVQVINYLDFIGYYRRLRKDSIMGSNSWKNTKDRIDSLGYLLELCKDNEDLIHYLTTIYIPYIKEKTYKTQHKEQIIYFCEKMKAQGLST